ncbi:hypothetical protein J2S48_002824 [Promicromonospora iranensis]|uniref:Uncharacterized protein n=1 Tax=Promicromonospora iranensis TaxID=1105144 RepID=A0ABU2CPM8_9MICO|nr:hypothetical protein [Promicromonospora iranensis]
MHVKQARSVSGRHKRNACPLGERAVRSQHASLFGSDCVVACRPGCLTPSRSPDGRISRERRLASHHATSARSRAREPATRPPPFASDLMSTSARGRSAPIPHSFHVKQGPPNSSDRRSPSREPSTQTPYGHRRLQPCDRPKTGLTSPSLHIDLPKRLRVQQFRAGRDPTTDPGPRPRRPRPRRASRPARQSTAGSASRATTKEREPSPQATAPVPRETSCAVRPTSLDAPARSSSTQRPRP